MKLVLILLSLLGVAQAEEICLTNGAVTFTNLEGTIYHAVLLTAADQDGVIWRQGAGGGRVCYTNLHPDLLEAWGIPTNRIAEARRRAERRAAWNARDRLQFETQAQAVASDKQVRQQQALAAEARQQLLDAKQADVRAIEQLSEEIEQAKLLLRRAQAIAHDHNQANRYNERAPRLYVKDTERVKIQEAEKRLKRMKQDYSLKYGERVR